MYRPVNFLLDNLVNFLNMHQPAILMHILQNAAIFKKLTTKSSLLRTFFRLYLFNQAKSPLQRAAKPL